MTTPARIHHPFSPSKLQYLEASPLYEGANVVTEKSEAGTRQHEKMGDETLDIDDPELSDEELEAVLKCRTYRDAIKDSMPGCTVAKELYLPIDDAVLLLPDDTSVVGTTAGYVDEALLDITKTEAHIFDWKFGMWSVEPAETNLQGIAYLLGLVHGFPTLKKVTVHFVMPHRDEIECHTFTSEQFPALYLRVRTVVMRALEARKIGWMACNTMIPICVFCANLGRCHKAAEFAIKVAHKYSPTEVPANVEPTIVGDMAASTQLMGIALLMEAWAKAIRRQITNNVIENADWMPDNYVMRTRVNNKMLDWKGVVRSALAAGVPQIEIDKAMRVGMTEIHQAISDISARGEKKMAVKAFTEGLLVAKFLEKEQPVYFLERLKS